MISRIVQSKSKTFAACCFCFLVGVVVASLFEFRIDYAVWLFCFFVLLSGLIVFWEHLFWRFVLLCIVLFCMGVIRYQFGFPVENSHHVSHFTDTEQTVVGYVASEPDVRQDGVRYIVRISDSSSFSGNMYFRSELYPRYRYGDVLKVTCRLKKPEPIEDFRYDMYLARYGVFAICQPRSIERVDEGSGDILFRWIFSLKNWFAKKIHVLWHEPYASFMAGLLYGYRGGLGQLNELFAITGVTHIVAISGYNITIISSILIAFFTSLYVPRKKAFWFVVGGIALFVLFAGASASVVRAGIMGGLVLFARQLGRASRVGNVLLLTAVIMTVHNPFVLVWDAGFQLSFLSTMGLVYLTPLIEPYLKRVPETLGIRESFVSTLAATIVTLPLILYQFGRLSLVAVIVNVLILWVLPFIMFLGFVAVLLSAVIFPIGQVLAWIAWGLMKYIVEVVTFFASVPFAAVDILIPGWCMVSLYLGMVYLVSQKTRKQKSNKTTLL